MNERFGKYELLRRIGVGGMAEVFVAKTHGAEGFVKHLVIKRILPAFNEDPEFVRMFINEAHLAARLQHANIVQIYDFDHVDETYYIAMEWVDGTDLRRIHNLSRRRQIPLPANVAVHVGVETLKGLHYAHSKTDRGQLLQLVHRDISPHNLLVSFSGEVKITDFGIAKVAALAGATRSGAVKGKLTYMSPEQINGEQVDARTDIFALGIVLWELLAERRLYAGAGSEGELMAAVRRADTPPLRSVNERVDAGLARVVERMLARDADDRYQTAAEALGDLSSFASISDSLELSDYLTKLMPAEAGREQRGNTAVMSQPAQPGYSEAAADAPTRTAPEDDVSDDYADGASGRRALTPSASASGAPSGSASTTGRAVPKEPPRVQVGSLTAMQPVRALEAPSQPQLQIAAPAEDDVPARPARGAGRWLAAAIALLLAGAGGWFVTGTVRGGGVQADARPEAVLLVRSKPSGAEVFVAGMRLPRGRTPLTLHGPRGASIEIELKLDGDGTSVKARFGEPLRVVALGGDDKGAADARPVVDAAPTTPADAAPIAPDIAIRPDRAIKRDSRLRRDARRPVARKAYGTLDIFCVPWAHVEIDGKPIGKYTPVKNLRLRVGRHVVKLSNNAIDKSRTVRVRIRKNKTSTINVTLGR